MCGDYEKTHRFHNFVAKLLSRHKKYGERGISFVDRKAHSLYVRMQGHFPHQVLWIAPGGDCISGDTPVRMGDGGQKAAHLLRAGDVVFSPALAAPAVIVATVRCGGGGS